MTDADKNKIYLAIIAVLLFIIATMAYKFIIAGATVPAEDGRLAIILEPGERALMLREMRDFVSGLQRIADALSREDMQDVEKASRALGSGRAHDVPASLMGKLPLEFKTLARSVHGEFDAIAMDAEAIGMPKRTLEQLSGALQKCAACHASYQVKSAELK